MRGRNPILPQRRRRIPSQFSWVDHRLVRDGHIQGRSAEALALYLFLVSVSDADGLSWYSEAALCRMLSWQAQKVQRARAELCFAELVAYRKPLYQVLDLSRFSAIPKGAARTDEQDAVAIGEVLRGLMRGGAE